jgi:hypothetical protein
MTIINIVINIIINIIANIILVKYRSRQLEFNGSLLELHTEGTSTSMLKAVANGIKTMELSSDGKMELNGLKLSSGGIHVETGGIEVYIHILMVTYLDILIHMLIHLYK